MDSRTKKRISPDGYHAAMSFSEVVDAGKLHRLIRSLMLVESDLSLPVILRQLVDEAAGLVDAEYAAMGVLDATGRGLEQFVTSGMDEAMSATIGPYPAGRGVLGLLISEPRPLRLADLRTHPERFGFPPGHPEMSSFLGVPISSSEQVYGHLYLTNKRGGAEFTEEDESLVVALAVGAGIAIEHARLLSRIKELTLIEDRDRIARDLHDTVIQRLFAVGLSLQGTASAVADPEIAERIHRAVEGLDATITQLRAAIFELEAALHSGSLRMAVKELVEEEAQLFGLESQLTFFGPVDTAATPLITEHLLATLREVLSNVGRHAQATSIDVAVAAADSLVLVVSDDGIGIGDGEESGAPAPGHGHGLRNMALRAEQLGGSFLVEPSDLGGARVVWSVPVSPAG